MKDSRDSEILVFDYINDIFGQQKYIIKKDEDNYYYLTEDEGYKSTTFKYDDLLGLFECLDNINTFLFSNKKSTNPYYQERKFKIK